MRDYSLNGNLKPNICIITSPRPNAGIVPLSNLIDVLQPISGSLFIITGNKAGDILKGRKDIQGRSIENKVPKQFMAMILNYILLQFKISSSLLERINKSNVFIFFEGECLLLPLLTAKIFKKPVFLGLAASMPNILEAEGGTAFRTKILKLMEILNYHLSDRIIIFSPKLIEDWHLNEFKSKISIARQHFLDLEVFNIFKRFEDRDCVIGYIGRLEAEKGAINFVKAIPDILKKTDSARFIVGGCGSESKDIRKFIEENNLSDKVELPGWIQHDDLPKYLNEIKLLIIPSYTEGLPNVMLESMACGSVVLSTPVGAIPDFIQDGKTGFILKDNSPNCIVQNISKALNNQMLDNISKNARALIEKEITYKVAVDKWSKILNEI